MSGWDLNNVAGKVFGLFFIASGLLQLLATYRVPLVADGGGARAGDLKLRYGDGRTDLRETQPLPRWPAFMMIGLGALYLFLPRFGGRMEPVLLIVMGGLLLAVGLASCSRSACSIWSSGAGSMPGGCGATRPGWPASPPDPTAIRTSCARCTPIRRSSWTRACSCSAPFC